MKQSITKIASVLLIICLNWTGLSAVTKTVCYFFDNENGENNTFQAATLDFSLTGADFSPNGLNPGESTTGNITLQKDGILEFQYKVNYEYVSGNLCDNLELTANAYSGLLKDFINQGPFTFSTAPNWNFTVSLPSSASDDLQGEICQFKLVFNAWQENLMEGQGFYDIEEIQSTILANYWNPPVVLNEFLPNPSGDDCSLSGINGEWVEIYNRTSNPLDLADWYIKNSIGTQVIISTLNTLGGFTTINANDWLVVFMDGCVLDNTSDTVTLYNQNNIKVDSYAYDLPEYNVNNTPCSTNNIVMYLPLDDNTNDQSGNGNNGTNNGATFTTGKFSQGLSFDGTNDTVTINDSNSLDISDQITIETWINPSTTINHGNSNKRILDKQNAYYLLFDYPSADGKVKFILRIGGNYINVSSITDSWNAGQWYHIVGTYDGSIMKIYVNGILENSKSKTGNIENTNYNLFLGSRAVNNIPTNMFFDGIIDEIKLYNKELDATEILAHYGQVPENKSYARIPDGSSNWVDPVPTPGGPNIETEEINNSVDITGLELMYYEEIPTVDEIAETENNLLPNETQQTIEETGIIDEIVNAIVEEILPEETLTEQLIEEITTIEEPEEPIIEESITEGQATIEDNPAKEQDPISPDNTTNIENGDSNSNLIEDIQTDNEDYESINLSE